MVESSGSAAIQDRMIFEQRDAKGRLIATNRTVSGWEALGMWWRRLMRHVR